MFNNFYRPFLAIFISIIIWLILKSNKDSFTSIVDFKNYSLKKTNHPQLTKTNTDKERLLQKVIARIDKLVNACCIQGFEYPDAPRANLMKQRWKKVSVGETSKQDTEIAYVINKDQELRICLSDPKTDKAEEINTAMFVALHEMGHLMSSSYGHGPEFWTNFKLILRKAIKEKLYIYKDYSKNSEQYCGLNIHDNPCTDSTCKTD